MLDIYRARATLKKIMVIYFNSTAAGNTIVIILQGHSVSKMVPLSLCSHPYAGSILKKGSLDNSIRWWLGLPLVYPGLPESVGPLLLWTVFSG